MRNEENIKFRYYKRLAKQISKLERKYDKLPENAAIAKGRMIKKVRVLIAKQQRVGLVDSINAGGGSL